MGNQSAYKQKTKYMTIQNGNTSSLMRRSHRRDQASKNNLYQNHISADYSYNKNKFDTLQEQISSPNKIRLNSSSYQNQSSLQPSIKEPSIYQQSRVRKPVSRSVGLKTPSKPQQDRILRNLSQKNQQLRKQLKRISDQLTEKLKRKKFVPKKKQQNLHNQYQIQESDKKIRAIKRQLENGYRQIDMYKRTLQSLRGKDLSEQAVNLKIQRIENNIADLDVNINIHIKKIEGLKKIKGGQQKAIQKEMNQQMHDDISTYKYELQQIKKKLKELNKKDQARQVNYKKQQAYLCQVQKKLRIINDQYFTQRKQPEKLPPKKLVTKKAKQQRNSITSDPTLQDFLNLKQDLQKLRAKHEQYHKKIDEALQRKNKVRQENRKGLKQIAQKQVLHKNLLKKLQDLKKLNQPPKKNFFGSMETYQGDETPQDQEQIIEQKEPDQFDIQHLFANIPKPVRQKPKMQVQIPKKQKNKPKPQDLKKDLMITLEKSEPKKWDSILSRRQQKGKSFKGEVLFNDTDHFQSKAQPLIVGVNVWVDSNNSILGIQAIYLKKQDIRYGYKSSSITEGKIQHFDLNRPDYLKNITGSISSQGFIQYLVLSSKQGKISRFGNNREDHQNFNFGLSSSQRPFLLFGASTLYQGIPKLNRLGLQICGQG